MYGGFLLSILVLLPLIVAPICYSLHKKNRTMSDIVSILTCAVMLALSSVLSIRVAQGAAYELTLSNFGGFGLTLKLDGFRAIYLTITAFMWLSAALFGKEYFARDKNTGRFHLFSLLTLSATAGLFLSADLLTTFLFFEWVSLCSYALVAHDESPKALNAALTYLTIAVIGGLAILMGLFLLFEMTGTLKIAELAAACASIADRPRLYFASALLLVGFGAKAGLFPLHIWLPQAHPAAPAPASALLSGVLTKTGIFGVLIICCELLPGDINWGIAILVLATVTMLLGAVLALFSNDLKRTLACSSISQIGFVVVGIASQTLLGTHNALAVRGTLLHMVNHSLVKLVLFAAAGVVYMNLHKLDLNEIRGWGRGKPLLAAVFLIGALNLAGVPFFSGYVSKTLLHESLVECIHLFQGMPFVGLLELTEVLFIVTGGLTAAYMAKLYIAIFVEKPATALRENSRYISPLTATVLSVASFVLPVFGVLPHQLPERLAAFGEGFMHGHAPEHAVHYFDWVNLKGAVISLTIGAVIYIVVVRGLMMRKLPDGSREYADLRRTWLDLDKQIYRPILRALYAVFVLIFTKLAVAPSKEGQTVSLFYEKFHLLFYPAQDKAHLERTRTGSFSFSLLFMGLGLCAVLAWMLWTFNRSLAL